jgi:hypothetical protein
MITIKKDQRTIRETSSDFQYNDPDTGDLKTEKIRVLYYSPTTAQTKETQAEIQKRLDDKKSRVGWYFSDSLIRLLHSLPDLVDENDQPHKITLEFLDSLDAINLERINDAITEDINAGKSQPAK